MITMNDDDDHIVYHRTTQFNIEASLSKMGSSWATIYVPRYKKSSPIPTLIIIKEKLGKKICIKTRKTKTKTIIMIGKYPS